jgi:ATP-dependent Clp protease ATP-binding subunit ClpC
MMFERFTDTAREIVVQPQANVMLRIVASMLSRVTQGPLAELTRRRRRRHAGRNAPQPAGPVGNAQPLPGPAFRGHIPFTPRAKKSMELSLREADALHDGSIGAQHITLALLIPQDGTVPRILAALGVQPASVRAAILDRYRKAS